MAIAALVAVALAASPALTAEPPFIVHGGSARIEVILGDPRGEVELTTSVGTLADGKLAGDRYVATLQSPPERYPQVALIAAKLTSGGKRSLLWLALPIHGRDTLKLSTKPGAVTVVTIAGKSFEPRTADAKGKVEVPVVVPPGVLFGKVATKDRLGNRKEKPVDLEPPPFLRLRVLPLDEAASWAEQPLPVEIFAVRPDGTPLSGAAGALSLQAAGGGTFGSVAAGPPGVYRTEYRAPDRIADGAATLRASLKGERLASEAKVSLEPGPAARIVLEPASSRYLAGAAAPLKLDAVAYDEKGNPLPSSAVELAPDFGEVKEGPNGERLLSVPNEFRGRRKAILRARAGRLTEEKEIELRAGPPSSGELTLEPEMIRAGGEGARAVVSLRDRFGNPVTEARLVPSVTAGKAERIKELGDGRYELAIVADEQAKPGPHQLEVRAPEGSVALAAPMTVLPSLRSWSVSAGAFATAHSNFFDVQGAGPVVDVSVRAGRSSLELIAQAGGSTYRSKPGELEGVRVSFSNVALAVGARYSLPLSAFGSGHASLAVGPHLGFATHRVALDDSQLSVEWDAPLTQRLGPFVRGAAGYSHRVGPGRILCELQLVGAYLFRRPESDIHGNLGGLSLGLGYLVDVR